MLEGKTYYRYMLQLDERAVVWTNSSTQTELKKVHKLLMNKLLDEEIDYNLNHYVKFNNIPRRVLFEQNVSDSFLKKLYIERRMKDLEKDFVE